MYYYYKEKLSRIIQATFIVVIIGMLFMGTYTGRRNNSIPRNDGDFIPVAGVVSAISSMTTESTGNTLKVEDSEAQYVAAAYESDTDYLVCVVNAEPNCDGTTIYSVAANGYNNNYIGEFKISIMNTQDEMFDRYRTNNKIEYTVEEGELTDINLEIGKYYRVTTLVGVNDDTVEPVKITSYEEATEEDIEEFNIGRKSNSSFAEQFSELQELSPLEAYSKAVEYQYGWTFEQIEIFKAYIESQKAISTELNDEWTSAISEVGTSLGY